MALQTSPLLALGVLLAGAGSPSAEPVQHINHGYKTSKAWLKREYVVSAPTGEEMVEASKLPKKWDWRDVDGKSYVVSDVNQHVPQYCGSCWIHGTIAALNDRIKVARGGAYPDIMLSRQALLNCVPGENASAPPPGCNGGDAYQIHSYMHHHPIPDETCMPYQAGRTRMRTIPWCLPSRNCAPTIIALPGVPTGCFDVPGWQGFTIGDHGSVKGERAMMKEIFARGPIACNMACDADFVAEYSENVLKHDGVFAVDTKFNDTDHVVSVAGWGETPSGIKYWIVRNSWGTYWGELGWFKIRRGVNQNLIESECDWAVPKFADLDQALEGKVLGSYGKGLHTISSEGLLGETAIATAAAPLTEPAAAPPAWDAASLALGAAVGGAAVAAAAVVAFFASGLSRRLHLSQRFLLG